MKINRKSQNHCKEHDLDWIESHRKHKYHSITSNPNKREINYPFPWIALPIEMKNKKNRNRRDVSPPNPTPKLLPNLLSLFSLLSSVSLSFQVIEMSGCFQKEGKLV